MIRILLPYHLRTLARIPGEVLLDVPPPVTQRALLDALESAYPALRGTIRDHLTGQRRPLIRFFAAGQDVSLDPPDTPLPVAITSGKEPFAIIGALAGG